MGIFPMFFIFSTKKIIFGLVDHFRVILMNFWVNFLIFRCFCKKLNFHFCGQFEHLIIIFRNFVGLFIRFYPDFQAFLKTKFFPFEYT